jgi:predicted Zn-dependent protease with MMP-like domain
VISWRAARRRELFGAALALDHDPERRARIEIALRERNLDTLALEGIPQCEQHLAAHIGEAVDRIADPEAQNKIDRGVAEGLEVAGRMRGSDLTASSASAITLCGSEA